MKSVFIFGTSIFPKEPEKDLLVSLPLEIVWKIFSLLDDRSLLQVTRVHPSWRRIVRGDRALWQRIRSHEAFFLWGGGSARELSRCKKMWRRNRGTHSRVFEGRVRRASDCREKEIAPTNDDLTMRERRTAVTPAQTQHSKRRRIF